MMAAATHNTGRLQRADVMTTSWRKEYSPPPTIVPVHRWEVLFGLNPEKEGNPTPSIVVKCVGLTLT